MNLESEAPYDCPACGEEIVIPIDLHAGRDQEYVEDCPVCCHPNLLRITWDLENRPRIEARTE